MLNKLDKDMKVGIILGIITLIGLCMITYCVVTYFDEDPLPNLPLAPSSFSGVVGDNITTNLGIGWQLISMPDTMNKENIYINYDNNTYSWNEAVTNNYIADIIFEYHQGNYVEVEEVIKTHGYWMYTFVENIYLSDEQFVLYAGKITYDGTEHITCNKLVLAPEYFSNEISCASLVATDMYEFYYQGGDVLQ